MESESDALTSGFWTNTHRDIHTCTRTHVASLLAAGDGGSCRAGALAPCGQEGRLRGVGKVCQVLALQPQQEPATLGTLCHHHVPKCHCCLVHHSCLREEVPQWGSKGGNDQHQQQWRHGRLEPSPCALQKNTKNRGSPQKRSPPTHFRRPISIHF